MKRLKKNKVLEWKPTTVNKVILQVATVTRC